ncbi:MAG: hypothetical protein Q8N10_03225 [Phenylobacterium sp.]|uniref:hypothetical protein n=1 Tax=Phenylobacterium sp. TaxID=1871053 RepID=UPI002719379F|nr:hypothetical protein [Phenylobacterium sp.]MDO8912281.1 hypothetical protein [Phenylobacterium sp.]MDP3099493.1 hypothetical protein [Phenylobacterium sp.]
MSGFAAIGQSIVAGVNWPTVFYLVVAVLALVALDKFANVSLGGVLVTLMAELKDLAGKRFTAGAANIVGVLSMTVLTGAYILSPNVKEMVAIVAGASIVDAGSDGVAPLIGLGIVAATILGSVLVVQAGARKP